MDSCTVEKFCGNGIWKEFLNDKESVDACAKCREYSEFDPVDDFTDFDEYEQEEKDVRSKELLKGHATSKRLVQKRQLR